MLENLNSEQRLVAEKIDQNLLVIAGAGSGKTRAITYRIANLIENGVNSYNILAITFTNKAAGELKDRINSLVGDSYVQARTFHSLSALILRREAKNLKKYNENFVIIDTDDTIKLIKKIIVSNNLYLETTKKDIYIYLSQMKKIKNGSVIFDNIEIEKLYDLYISEKIKMNLMDFDDLISNVIELFETNSVVLKSYQDKYQYIHIDEFQDINDEQMDFIKLLTGVNSKVVAVGDEDQSIYAFRGANINNIDVFKKTYNPLVLKLQENYRSTSNILSLANNLISNNKNRIEKTLKTSSSSGDKIDLVFLNNESNEAEYIAQCILKDQYENFNKKIAILYRMNSSSQAIEKSFVTKNIKYKVIGGFRFYERGEIKDIISYLRLLNSTSDDMAFSRVINVPKRKIGISTIEKISNFANEKNIAMFDVIDYLDELKLSSNVKNTLIEFKELILKYKSLSDELSIKEITDMIVEDINYYDYLESNDGKDIAFSKKENVKTLIHSMEDTNNLTELLEQISLYGSSDEENDDSSKISLMTVHASKGLEFDKVYIIGLTEGVFPSARANSSFEIEEERRLMYVAITRAKENLIITSPYKNGYSGYGNSIFISELDDLFINKIEMTLEEEKLYIPSKNKVQMKAPIIELAAYNIGDKIEHPKYGIGEVKTANIEELEIHFDSGEIKFFVPDPRYIKKI